MVSGRSVTALRYLRHMTTQRRSPGYLLSEAIISRIETLSSLSRWERSELGRDLRRSGLTYAEIGELVPAAKATIAGWCRGIELTKSQRDAIRERTGSRKGVPVDTQRRRRLEIEQIRAAAVGEAAQLSAHPTWTAGVALCWAEGFKTERLVGMANSDEALLRFFMMWIRRYLDDSASFRAKLNLHAANHEVQARAHWAAALGLDAADFSKTFVKPEGTGHRKNHLAHGVCQLRMRSSGDSFHRTMAWVDHLRTAC